MQLIQTPIAVFQTLTAGATHTESAAFNASTKWIEVTCTVDTWLAFGTAPVADTTGFYCVANQVKRFGFPPNASWKVSCLRVGGTDGKVAIAESFQSPTP